MSDDIPLAPFPHESLDPASEPKSPIAEVSDAGALVMSYVDGSPNSSSEEFKAAHPLEAAKVVLDDKPDRPGEYEAKFFITPHYQLEGASVALRLVSSLNAA